LPLNSGKNLDKKKLSLAYILMQNNKKSKQVSHLPALFIKDSEIFIHNLCSPNLTSQPNTFR